MEMHQLRYVVAVARAGNFSRAAEQCHVSQPSLSQQVQKLEEELGERLFVRTKREARLTQAGEDFLPRAVRILEEAEAARREIADTRGLLRGRLTVGVLPTIAPYLLPAVLSRFTRSHPGLEVIVNEDTTAQLLRQVLAYEADLALVSDPITEPRVEVRELMAEELLLALPPGHRLSRHREVRAADISDERLIVMREGHCLGEQVLRFCHRRHLRPQISFRSAQLETIQALVHAGLGLALVPAMARQRHPKERPEYRSLQMPRPERKILAIWPRQKPLGRAPQEFLALLERPVPTRPGRKPVG
jgi:LysR family hydrogen peroxide-inducible transcriptional activator